MNFHTIAAATAAAHRKANNSSEMSEDQRQYLLSIAESLGVPQDQASQIIASMDGDTDFHQKFEDCLDTIDDPDFRDRLGLDKVRAESGRQTRTQTA